ncbi:MAG: arginine deiminase-related protein [Gammaproteobacteria bacterium]
MVRPAAFGPNPETAATNRFQATGATDPEIVATAQAEFDGLARALADAGIEVMRVEDTSEPAKPDATFPNNWFSTHADGTAVLYPMLAPSRRLERRPEMLVAMAERHGRVLTATIDLSHWEREGCALEGTGSLVLDRRRRIAYACLSPRTASAPLAQWARLMDYRVESFVATGPDGVAIYHTNVMLTLGRGFAAVGLEAIADAAERQHVAASLEEGGCEIWALDRRRLAGFAGNLLHLEGTHGPVIAMSETARRSLGPALVTRLERYGEIVVAPIATIERYGGGSVRCMLAEMFLPRAPT